MSIEERIEKCLDENGLNFKDGKLESLDGEVSSFNLISAMVSLEEEFEIEIPEAYMELSLFSSMEHLVEVISSLKK